ncbi:MAG: hypothetical protein EOO62_02170 [Hymenobacter sp.]|nr:MAG: hypothetical protein EOO62_02170 [Hymenobacter sp.]
MFACAAEAWQPLTVGRVTILFPAAPTRINNRELAGLPPTARGWMVRTPDGLFILLQTKLARPIGQQDTTKRRAIYDSISRQTLRISKGRVVQSTYFATAGGIGQELSYRYFNRYFGEPKPTTFFMRNVVVDSANYFLQYLPNDIGDSLGLAGAAPRRRFFHSITVQP